MEDGIGTTFATQRAETRKSTRQFDCQRMMLKDRSSSDCSRSCDRIKPLSKIAVCPVSPLHFPRRLIAAALKQSDAIDRDFLTKAVEKVIVRADRLDIEVSKRKLRAILLGDRLESKSLADETSSDLIRLEVRAQLRRHGGEMCLVVPADSANHVTPPPVSSLLKAIARGRQWHEWIVNGEASSQRSIASRLGFNERYVRRVLKSAFLAPDILESILDGRQPWI